MSSPRVLSAIVAASTCVFALLFAAARAPEASAINICGDFYIIKFTYLAGQGAQNNDLQFNFTRIDEPLPA